MNTGYPKDKIHFIKGKVKDAIPENLPESLALLRLDTDWYESTRHGLTHLYPLLSSSGVLVIDD
jgi:O-methyltransferase